MGQLIGIEDVVKLFEIGEKKYWGKNNACAISTLELATLDSGVKSTVTGIVSAIATTSDGIISLRETGF